ncbi:uncharacterized protein LOC121382100 [Gigantopelta aegis]|uniref:uncharacterized protein LOC121382100 n=1 Tax=Gigantopelta aegis TaxID=1735272 RepID=UPI001B88C7C1|nr:uncharacterized protein LOC121382100 [Gigantopelta aegis]
MQTVVLIAIISVLPVTVLSGCAEISSCSSNFSTESGVECTKLAAYISCLKTSGCHAIAQTITNLDQIYNRLCVSSTPGTNNAWSFLASYVSLNGLSYHSIANCHPLTQCSSSMPVDTTLLSKGDYSQICPIYTHRIGCWKRASTSCSLPSELAQHITRTQSMLDALCSVGGGSKSFTASFINLVTSGGSGLEGCKDVLKCVFKAYPMKDGKPDQQALQNIQQDKPAMCRMAYASFKCIVTGDAGCSIVAQMKPYIDASRKQLIEMCGKDPNGAGLLTGWTVLIYVLVALVMILHS